MCSAGTAPVGEIQCCAEEQQPGALDEANGEAESFSIVNKWKAASLHATDAVLNLEQGFLFYFILFLLFSPLIRDEAMCVK